MLAIFGQHGQAKCSSTDEHGKKVLNTLIGDPWRGLLIADGCRPVGFSRCRRCCGRLREGIYPTLSVTWCPMPSHKTELKSIYLPHDKVNYHWAANIRFTAIARDNPALLVKARLEQSQKIPSPPQNGLNLAIAVTLNLIQASLRDTTQSSWPSRLRHQCISGDALFCSRVAQSTSCGDLGPQRSALAEDEIDLKLNAWIDPRLIPFDRRRTLIRELKIRLAGRYDGLKPSNAGRLPCRRPQTFTPREGSESHSSQCGRSRIEQDSRVRAGSQ